MIYSMNRDKLDFDPSVLEQRNQELGLLKRHGFIMCSMNNLKWRSRGRDVCDGAGQLHQLCSFLYGTPKKPRGRILPLCDHVPIRMQKITWRHPCNDRLDPAGISRRAAVAFEVRVISRDSQ